MTDQDRIKELEERVKSLYALKDLLVDELNKFTKPVTTNGGETLLVNNLQPKVDELEEKLKVAREALKFYGKEKDGERIVNVCEFNPTVGRFIVTMHGEVARRALKEIGEE